MSGAIMPKWRCAARWGRPCSNCPGPRRRRRQRAARQLAGGLCRHLCPRRGDARFWRLCVRPVDRGYQRHLCGRRRPIGAAGANRAAAAFRFAHITRTSGVRSYEATARASVGFRRVNLTGQVDWSRSNSPFGPDPPDRLTARLLANASIGRLRLRGEAQFALSGAQSDTRLA